MIKSRMCLESSILAQLVKHLESASVINRCRDPKDERQCE
ncbi:MarR family transcriptional regulator [Pseudomonas migulae]